MKNNFVFLVILIIFIMNEISLFHSLVFPLHKAFDEKYLLFLQNLINFCEKIGEWALVSKIIKVSLDFFRKKICFDNNFVGSQSLFVIINSILCTMTNNKTIVSQEFFKEKSDLLTNFVNFLKIIKNNGRKFYFVCINYAFSRKN